MIHTDFGFMGEEDAAELFIILLFSPSLTTFPLYHTINKQLVNMLYTYISLKLVNAQTVLYPSDRLSLSRFFFISAFLASNSSLPIIGCWRFIRFPISARSLLKSHVLFHYLYNLLIAIMKIQHHKLFMN